MKESLNRKFLNFFVPLKKVPVKGFQVKLGSGKHANAIDQSKIKLKGAQFQLELPWGTGVAIKELGFWSWLQPELPPHVKSSQTHVDFEVPAHDDVKIVFRGNTWIIQLERDFAAVDLS